MSEHEEHLLQLLPLLQQVLTRAGVHRTKTGADVGMTNLQMGVLGSVYENDNCTMGELAEDRLVALPAATRIVDGLVKKNLMERLADGADRRVVRLRITPKGREAIDKVHQEAVVLLGWILEKMSAKEREALLVGLEAFIKAFIAVDEGG